MYIPEAYAWSDAAAIERFIAERGFATLVTPALDATSLPLLWRRVDGDGVLCGHLARRNAMAEGLDGQSVLLLYEGVDGYVSPDVYGKPDVPTWNYVSVQVHGTCRLTDPETTWQDLVDLVRAHDQAPGVLAHLEAASTRAEMAGLVGLRVENLRLEGKRKLSQNRPQADRMGVVLDLLRRRDPRAAALAAEMAGLLP